MSERIHITLMYYVQTLHIQMHMYSNGSLLRSNTNMLTTHIVTCTLQTYIDYRVQIFSQAHTIANEIEIDCIFLCTPSAQISNNDLTVEQQNGHTISRRNQFRERLSRPILRNFTNHVQCILADFLARLFDV